MVKKTNIFIWILILFTSYSNGQNFEWKQDTIYFLKVDNITYYFPSNILLETRTKAIDDCKKGIEETLKRINETEYTKEIDLVFVNTRKEVTKYTGQFGRGVAYDKRNVVFGLANRGAYLINHEMVHMILENKWGVPATSSDWLNEGLATYFTGYCSDYTLEEVYQFYIQSDKLIPMDSLSYNFRAYDDVISYTESAFLVKYLVDNFEITKVKQLWIEGIESFDKIYGLTVADYEESLIKMFKNQYPKDIQFNWDVFKNGCMDQ